MFTEKELQIDRIATHVHAIAQSPILSTNLLGISLKAIEDEIAAFHETLDKFQLSSFAIFQCKECFCHWQRDFESDEDNESFQDEVCPNCNTNHITFTVENFKSNT